jgi:hypothetical protein
LVQVESLNSTPVVKVSPGKENSIYINIFPQKWEGGGGRGGGQRSLINLVLIF